jgi:hypothetical protein
MNGGTDESRDRKRRAGPARDFWRGLAALVPALRAGRLSAVAAIAEGRGPGPVSACSTPC